MLALLNSPKLIADVQTPPQSNMQTGYQSCKIFLNPSRAPREFNNGLTERFKPVAGFWKRRVDRLIQTNLLVPGLGCFVCQKVRVSVDAFPQMLHVWCTCLFSLAAVGRCKDTALHCTFPEIIRHTYTSPHTYKLSYKGCCQTQWICLTKVSLTHSWLWPFSSQIR